MRWAACAVLVAACFDPKPPLGAPCTDDTECPTGQECDPVDLTCKAPTDLLAWHDDTAADFAADGALTDDVTIETQGFLGPPAFFTGAVRVAGIAGAFADENATTFEELAAQAITGTAVVRDRGGLSIDYSTFAPFGLDLPAGDDVTVLIEAEIELDVAGQWGFELTANERGFIDIAPPGGAFERLVADANDITPALYDAPVAGWYRIRGAFSDTSGIHRLELRYDPPNVNGNFRDIPSDRVRARVGDVEGLAVDGFEFNFMIDHRGTVVSTEPLDDLELDTDPFGLPVGTGAFAFRWSGQFLVDEDADYTFRIDTFEGQRVWIDGRLVSDAYGGGAVVTTPQLRLGAGWHDLVLDAQKNDGTAPGRVTFAIETGPGAGVLAADHLRPVPGRIARFATDDSGAEVAIPEGGTVTRSFSLDLPLGSVAQRVDVAVEVDHPALPTIQIVADPPAGANITLVAAGTLTGSGIHFEHRTLSATTAGAGWIFNITDTAAADAMTGTVTFAGVTVVTDGGVPPFPTTFGYTSRVRELGDVTAFGPFTWAVRQGEASAATFKLRTCDDAAACEAEPWTDIVFGAVPAVTPRRFAQYTVEVTTNGDIPTALDFIDLPYSTLSAP